MIAFIKRHPLLAAANASYLAAAGVGIFITRNLEFAFYLATLLVLIAVVLVVHHRSGLSEGVLWAFTLWGAAHMTGGLLPVPAGWAYHGDTPVMYSAWILPGWLKYDHVVHAWGFGACTVLCWQALASLLSAGDTAGRAQMTPSGGAALLCALAACGLGAANEMVEFVATVTMPSTNVGGYVNTALDLCANAVGAAVAAVGLRAEWFSPGAREPLEE